MKNTSEIIKWNTMNNEKRLDQEYWDNQYKTNATGWDLGKVSPPIKEYIDTLENKNISILIPGCGNSHEAEYLLSKGFTNITLIDIAPTLVLNLQEKFKNYPNIKIVLGDFFEHKGEYDLIIEQTFFCAINPPLRTDYVAKMKELLVPGGKLVGVLFDREFEQQGPPFGGCKCQYEPMFEKEFDFKTFELSHNSFVKRAGTELFINLIKKD